GTLEEWFEVFTWSQLGYHAKPCGLLNVNNFFNPLIAMLDHTIKEGFMNEDYREMIIISSDPIELLEKMDSYTLSYRSDEHTSVLQSRFDLVCLLLLEKIIYVGY